MGRRKKTRKIKRLPITFSDGNVEYAGTSSDFSSTGLFIRTRRAFGPGTSVRMVLEVGENRSIDLKGIVVRAIKTGSMVFKNGMGIKLTNIPQDYKNFAKELLK
jgi:Tfp pilus assembly protein PilZ